MKRYRLVFALALVFVFAFLSCKKINEATELGGDLVPAVDNINTFEAVLNTQTDNRIFGDTTKAYYSDDVALGKINDPVFGKTSADVYFNISSPTYGVNPFDSLIRIDSVVLSLAYVNTYGDTNSQHTVSVYEIAQNSNFSDTVNYYFNAARQSDFAVTGSVLGSKSFTTASLKDSIQVIRPGDTSKVANAIRIPLTNSLATRFSTFDTSATVDGGFHSDSLFKTLFRGFKIKAESSTGNGGLAYLSLSDQKTKLTVYYKRTKNGQPDTTSFSFYHTSARGLANLISRTPEGNYASTLGNSNPNDAELYIQTTPGTYASVVIPGLDTFSNKVVHRAELVAYRITTPGDRSDIFTPPTQLFLDRVKDTAAILLEKDIPMTSNGSLSFQTFGGTLKLDNSYRFNITRYIQEILTKHTANDTLRIYAPLRTNLLVPSVNTRFSIPVLSQVAYGRVVLAGGNYADPNLRLRLRVIYSKL